MFKMIWLFHLLIFTTYFEKITCNTKRPVLRRASNCTGSNVDINPVNWVNQNVDQKFEDWWNSPSHNTAFDVPSQLASQFAGIHGFDCGVGKFSSCTIQSCQLFNDSWPYLVVDSIVTLDTFFNGIHTGVTNGQLDFLGLTGSIANDFFPWNNPQFHPDEILFWVGAVITTIASAGVLLPEALVALGIASRLTPNEVSVIANSAGAFANAAAQQIALSLNPDLPPNQGLAQLGSFATSIGSQTRLTIEQWSNTTFRGGNDSLGKNLKDYLRGGSYSGLTLPSAHDIEIFFRNQMLARIINSAWTSQYINVFIMFANTTDQNDSHGPSNAKYYSKKDGGVYYLYSYQDGALRQPPGLDKASNATYNLTIADMVESSARAWQYNGFNYTVSNATDRILASISSNGSLTPFNDGISWEGVFTIPVCNVGSHLEWNTQYDDKKDGYGRLPCCCGPNCVDTKAFVQAANLKDNQDLLYGCEKQLQGSGVDFKSVDYGFAKLSAFQIYWNKLNGGQRFGVVLGFMISAILSLYLILQILVCICDC